MKRTSALLEPFLSKLGIAEGVRLIRIKNDWDTIFEKPLSLHMWPSKYSEGELLLNVDSPVWIHQLSYQKSLILKKLGAYGVKDVRFRVGKTSRKERTTPVTRRGVAELSPEDSSFISGLASDISDAEIREAIKNAAEKSLRANRGEGKVTEE